MFEILKITQIEPGLYSIEWRATYSPTKIITGTSEGDFETFPTNEEALGILDRVLNKPQVVETVRRGLHV